MNNYKLRTDDELVAMYIAGDNAAFDTLLAKYKDRLYSYIFYSIRNEDLTDDIFQETFVKAIMTMRQGRYTPDGKFYPWLTRIAHNLIIDQFRNEQNEKTISNDEVEKDLYGAGIVMGSASEKEYEAESNRREIFKLIDHLPQNQQEIVRMRVYKNLSFKEIARLKNVSINTALGRMHYAILNMRRMANERNLAPTIL